MTYGFIITRHVNSEKTNRYWNHCVKLIRTFYPLKEIIVIDDNSKQEFIKSNFNYNNLTVIQSEFPGRGEFLPYYYLLKYKWFNNAVIIHDSVFIHRRIPFEFFKVQVMPLWHHIYDKENLPNLIRIASVLTNNNELLNKLHGDTNNQLLLLKQQNNPSFNLCFGVQSYINLKFLESLEKKYTISKLVHVIINRTDRCSLERIMGLLFCQEVSKLKNTKSLFGDICLQKKAFNYYYEDYIYDLKKGRVFYPFVKVWTGR
jgi:hypothetical protein